jgi:exopolysaccharide production protein ExoZ
LLLAGILLIVAAQGIAGGARYHVEAGNAVRLAARILKGRVMTTSGRERLASIQVLRAAAAMGVVFAHLTESYRAVFNAKDVVWDFYYGNFGVDLFFVISGFVIVYASDSLFGQPGGSRKFVLRRLIRIVPLYWIATSYVLWDLLKATGLNLSGPTWKSIFGSYFFLPFPFPTGGPLLIVGWTLNYEMFFYVIFAVAVLFGRMRAVLLVTTVLCACVLVGRWWGGSLSTFWASFTNPLMLEFVMGMWIAVAFRIGMRIPRAQSALFILAGFAMIYFLPSSGAQDVARVVRWGGGFSLTVIAVALANAQARSSFWKPLVLMGEASYAIYLTHWLVMMPPPNLLVSIFEPATHPISYSVAIITAVILVGTVAHLAVEKPVMAALWFVMRNPFRSPLQEALAPATSFPGRPSQQSSCEPAQ